ncbi:MULTISPECIES: hypothetical protein [unclassified Duganella]|uniref:hypothetical protein n=1 Tax=unclassified Duganella TaxID=2636909 RepID=UPI00088CBC88|nr:MULTISPECIES: hypothetical protein [unclassified Duganella]SDF95439.1 hypothetical protein SAMN05216320_102157 [Duganella sp. OV458]SDJ09268.1 hypothetical protein SAMN05428973_102394 [Duganella sp. OV510]
MKRHATVAAMLLAALLTACHKKEKTEEAVPVAAPVPAQATAPVPAADTPPAEQTPEQREQARKKSQLEYGVMEDKYINDARAQWATQAKASSVFGGADKRKPGDSNTPERATGPADGNSWTNENIDKGFDWLELEYATPVNATEVRVVIDSGQGVEAINKVELQDTDGKWSTVWEGVNDVKRDYRGNRTWFVRSFDKTANKIKAVKLTYANNLQHDYKVVDAVQLVGDK